MFHSGFSKRNFWCKELISSWRIGKVSNLSPISAIFSRQTNDIYVNFFFQIFKASPYHLGKKLVDFDLVLLKIQLLFQILLFPSPVFERYDTKQKFQFVPL
jgi:hypothetical protein